MLDHRIWLQYLPHLLIIKPSQSQPLIKSPPPNISIECLQPLPPSPSHLHLQIYPPPLLTMSPNSSSSPSPSAIFRYIGSREMEGGIHVILLSCLVLSLLVVASSDDSSVQTKCAPEFQKLGGCLEFATAKANTPSSPCCTSVSDIRNKDAVCLCYIIQQTHAGSSTIKSIGLQFERLLQLPGACKLANASVSDCPKLLNIPPSSPDYSIFNGTTKATSGTTGPANATTSGGIMHQNHLDGAFSVAVVSAIFLYVFSIGA